MATKAQKRAAGAARAKQAAEESRLSGLRAQQDDHDRRAKKQQELMARKAAEEKASQGRMNAAKIAVVAEATEVAEARREDEEMQKLYDDLAKVIAG